MCINTFPRRASLCIQQALIYILTSNNLFIPLQEKFMTAQDRRRELGRRLAEIESRLKELHADMQNTMKGDEKYLQLCTEEHKVRKNFLVFYFIDRSIIEVICVSRAFCNRFRFFICETYYVVIMDVYKIFLNIHVLIFVSTVL